MKTSLSRFRRSRSLMRFDMQRNDYLIKRKFNSYLIPGVLMVMAMQLGNIVDSILVSGIIDIDGMTAISLSLPVLYFALIIGFAIGVGGAVTISVMLGKRQIKEASGVFSVCVIADVALSLIFSALAPVVSSPLAHFLAQTPRLEELLMPYIYMYLLFTPLINVCILVSNVVTIDNCPKLGASCLVIATVVNLGLDYFFLKYTSLGMYGAGPSTVIGYGVGNFVLIPYFLSRFGIKKVVLIALMGWVLRFAFFGLGNPGGGVWLFLLSMIVYGVAFDFFNISGSLFINQETDESIRSSAQGLFMMMTNGLGAFVGTFVAQSVINNYVFTPQAAGATGDQIIAGWQTCWYIFAAYALVVAILFAVMFRYKHERVEN